MLPPQKAHGRPTKIRPRPYSYRDEEVSPGAPEPLLEVQELPCQGGFTVQPVNEREER